MKKSLQWVVQSGQGFYLGLLALRAAPSKNIGKSAACILMKRDPISLLPSVILYEKEGKCSNKTLLDKTEHYNLHSKDLITLSPEDTVRIRKIITGLKKENHQKIHTT